MCTEEAFNIIFTKFKTVLKNTYSYVYISNIYGASEALKTDNEYFRTTQ